MGIRNPLEQNLLETKEQKEDVTTAWFVWSIQLPTIFEQRGLTKPPPPDFSCLACKNKINKETFANYRIYCFITIACQINLSLSVFISKSVFMQSIY